jgi:sugar lactone lactonase YvrE
MQAMTNTRRMGLGTSLLLAAAATVSGQATPTAQAPAHPVRSWQLSRSYPEAQVNHDLYPHFFTIFGAQWRSVESEPSGLVDISKHSPRLNSEGDCVLARAVFACPEPTEVRLDVRYSEETHLFLNGNKIFTGKSAGEPLDSSSPGIADLRDTMHLTLEKGLNELFFEVTDRVGGSGLICQTDVPLAPPARDHGCLSKAWETDADFNIPESVLYDPERQVLYVSSFARVQTRETHQGYLSRLTTDGEVRDHKWIDGVDGPCGMALANGRLYVVECSGHLVEIDPDAGEIIARHPAPGSTFLNDVAADAQGTVYFSDTTRTAAGSDVYHFRDGAVEVWKTGPGLARTNGLFVHDGALLAGSSGDGFFKSVDLKSGAVSPIVSLAPRIIDGIRVDNAGNYLVSHWEGQLYRITPGGEITELLDLLPEGLNIADFEYIKDQRLIVIPTFLGNKIVAYKLDE